MQSIQQNSSFSDEPRTKMTTDGVNNLYRRTEERLEELTSQLLSAAAPREDGAIDTRAFQQSIRNAVHRLNTLYSEADEQPIVAEIMEEPEQLDSPRAEDVISEETLEQDRSPTPEELVHEQRHFLQDIPNISDAELAPLLLSIEEVMREGFYARRPRQTQLHEDSDEARNGEQPRGRSTFQSVILRGYRTVQQHFLPGSEIITANGTPPGGGNGDDPLMRFLWSVSIVAIVTGHFLCVLDYRQQ